MSPVFNLTSSNNSPAQSPPLPTSRSAFSLRSSRALRPRGISYHRGIRSLANKISDLTLGDTNAPAARSTAPLPMRQPWMRVHRPTPAAFARNHAQRTVNTHRYSPYKSRPSPSHRDPTPSLTSDDSDSWSSREGSPFSDADDVSVSSTDTPLIDILVASQRMAAMSIREPWKLRPWNDSSLPCECTLRPATFDVMDDEDMDGDDDF